MEKSSVGTELSFSESNWTEAYDSPHHPIVEGVPSLQEVLSLLQIHRESVISVYPYGSRIFGVFGPDSGTVADPTSLSDWDMIVVVNDFVGPLVRAENHPGVILPGFEESIVLSEKLDVTVYHIDYWRHLLRENCLKILLCMGIPKRMVLLENEPLKCELNYQRLKSSVYDAAKSMDHLSRKYWHGGSIWSAKKQMLHKLRFAQAAIQLLQFSHIENYTSANPYWPILADIQFSSWEELKAWGDQHYLPLLNTLKDWLNVYKLVFSQKIPLQPVNACRILDYLQFYAHNRTHILDRDMSVRATFISYPLESPFLIKSNASTAKSSTEQLQTAAHGPTEPNLTKSKNSTSELILLERGWDSPRHDAIQQCYRIVATRSRAADDEDTKSNDHDLSPSSNTHLDPNAATSPSVMNEQKHAADWKVVAAGPKKYWEWGADRFVTSKSDKFVEVPEFATTKVYVKPQGIGVLVFWFDNRCCAVFASSGLYTAQYATRLSISLDELGKKLFKPFWECFERKGFQYPEAKSEWTYQFTFHPDEDLLQLDAIIDNISLEDLSMRPASQFIEGEVSNDPLFEICAKRYSWDCLQRVPVEFPAPKSKTDQSISRNMETVTKMAGASTEMSLLAHEGFLLMDAHGIRLQVTLPQFTSLTMLYSRYERKNRAKHFLKIVRSVIQLPSGSTRFCSYYPQWARWYDYIASAFSKLCLQMDAAFETISHIADPIQFKSTCESHSQAEAKIFWRLRSSNSNAMQFFTNPKLLNDGQTQRALLDWIDHFRIFEDLSQGDE